MRSVRFVCHFSLRMQKQAKKVKRLSYFLGTSIEIVGGKIMQFFGPWHRKFRILSAFFRDAPDALENKTVAIIRDAQFEFRIWNTSKPTNYLTISRPIVMLITNIFHSCLYAGIVRVNNFLSPFSYLFLTIFENGPV